MKTLAGVSEARAIKHGADIMQLTNQPANQPAKMNYKELELKRGF